MSARRTLERGFTIPELLITIGLIGVVVTLAAPVFANTFRDYFALNYRNEQFTSIAGQSQRIANVIRGLSDINTATANELDIYAYFYPNDSYVSKVRYYLSPSQDKLYADVTPMTANPPTGTLLEANKKTYTIISNFKKINNVNLFKYIDQNNNELSMPISNLEAIKAIQINLSVRDNNTANSGQQTMSLSVSLRNRKTNL